MDIQCYNPHDFFPDDGRFHKLYPIPYPKNKSNLVFDNKIQRTSHIQANIAAIFEEWFVSFFEANYFKFIRLKTESSFAEFKSFMKNIYKKDKPLMVIDVNASEHVEDSIFGLNMVNRYNLVDPRYDEWSAKLLYSIGLIETDNLEIRFRRNRYRFTFDVLIMENTMDRQLNTYTNMIMNMRHQSKFTLPRNVMNLIPLEYVHNIALSHGYKDYKTDEFLEFLNTHSEYPIIRRVLPNGQWMFYMQQEVHLYVDVPNMPQKDSPEMSNAFEWGAQIRDTIVIEADLPSEFIFLTSIENARKYVPGKDPDPEKIYYVAPDLAFPEFPEMKDGRKLVNQLKVVIDDPNDNSLNVLDDIIATVDSDIYMLIRDHMKKGYSIKDLVHVEVHGQKRGCSITQMPCIFEDHGELTILEPDYRRIYMILTYLDMKKINIILEGENKEYIGTIEKY